MSDLARLLQQYGYGEQPNALAQDGVTYDTSNVLAGMPKKNALADALRVAMNGIPENKEHSLSMLNMVRGGLGTAANWLEGRPEIGKDTLAPLGAGLAGALVGKYSRNALAPTEAASAWVQPSLKTMSDADIAAIKAAGFKPDRTYFHASHDLFDRFRPDTSDINEISGTFLAPRPATTQDYGKHLYQTYLKPGRYLMLDEDFMPMRPKDKAALSAAGLNLREVGGNQAAEALRKLGYKYVDQMMEGQMQPAWRIALDPSDIHIANVVENYWRKTD